MKNFLFFALLLFSFSGYSQTLGSAPKDTILVIGDKIYEGKIWSRYEIVTDTMAFHARILVINDQVAELAREKASLISKIAFFEGNKSEFMRSVKQPPKKSTAKKPSKSKKE